MILTKIDTDPFIAELFSLDRDKTRSPGVHLMQIVEAMLDERGLSRKRDDLDLSDLEKYRALGFIWERVLTDHLNATDNAIIRPGEFCVDGIYCTPDGLNMYDFALEEWKCTWTSSRKPVEDKLSWWMQIKAYCKVLGIARARLRVFYVNGTWNPPIPDVAMYQADFTDQEIHENWQAIVNFAKARGMLV